MYICSFYLICFSLKYTHMHATLYRMCHAGWFDVISMQVVKRQKGR